ncbi:MAG: extracellular solute-binding protein [Clostridiales bacterium]|nr:extracellular solute-binding protein [Clostridiales bacterium]
MMKLKNKFNITVSSILSTTLLFLPLVSSCQSQQDNSVDSGNTESTESPVATENASNLPEKNYNGEEFNFLGTGGSKHSGYYETKDIYAESSSGDILNDAIYDRNRAIEERFNVKIKLAKSDEIIQDVTKMVNANDCPYDGIFGFQFDLYTLAAQGYLTDLNTVEYIDLKQAWWDKNSLSSFRLQGKNYFVTGDISTLDDACTRLTLFNKKIIRDYDLESPYELVNDNKWTFDKFAEMTRQISVDVNGDSKMEAGDLFGCIGEGGLPNILFTALGGNYIKAENNTYTVTITSEANMEKVAKIFDLLMDTSCIPNTNTWKDLGGYKSTYTYGRALFAEDKFLFHFGCPLVFDELRNMDSDFGIVPPPKYDSEQERYYCYVDVQAPMLALTVCTPDFEKSGIILEAMAAESKKTVTPAYNEIVLKRKHSRDSESAAMLDIIAESREYCLIEVTDWGGIAPISKIKYNRLSNVSISDYAGNIEKTEADIKHDMKIFESLK